MLNKVMTQCGSLKNTEFLKKNQCISNCLQLFILI